MLKGHQGQEQGKEGHGFKVIPGLLQNLTVTADLDHFKSLFSVLKFEDVPWFENVPWFEIIINI